jgi:hypothetical protein
VFAAGARHGAPDFPTDPNRLAVAAARAAPAGAGRYARRKQTTGEGRHAAAARTEACAGGGAGGRLDRRSREPAAEFFRGRTLKIVVGFGPGGGYDLYARLLAKYLPAHIPGAPSVVVENMEGAGSVRAANFVYEAAPRDGSVIAAVNQNAPMYQLLGGASVPIPTFVLLRRTLCTNVGIEKDTSHFIDASAAFRI